MPDGFASDNTPTVGTVTVHYHYNVYYVYLLEMAVSLSRLRSRRRAPPIPMHTLLACIVADDFAILDRLPREIHRGRSLSGWKTRRRWCADWAGDGR